MPEVNRPIDRWSSPVAVANDKDKRAPLSALSEEPIKVTDGLARAVENGVRGKCPRCGSARLFPAFLKPVKCCPACGQDWSLQRADDFPAYVSIFITGHIVTPVIIVLVQATQLALWALVLLVVLMALGLMIATLQPAKGAIIALQWWFEMHDFRRRSPDTD